MDSPQRVEFAWLTQPDLLSQVTQLFVSEVTTEYVSHGDIMEGRAEGPGRWYPDLAELHQRELASVELEDGVFSAPGYRIALAWLESTLVGFASVAHVVHDASRQHPVRYGRIDDIVVAATARGLGVGTGLMSWIEQELVAAGVTRVFLESGINNTRAHALFQRRGYTITSVTMFKDLDSNDASRSSATLG